VGGFKILGDANGKREMDAEKKIDKQLAQWCAVCRIRGNIRINYENS
jgi:hypothetical protein